jgi:hypothetical protein
MSPAVTGPDPIDRFQLLGGGAAEADRPVFGGDPGRRRGTARAELGDEDLLAVREPRGQVDRFQRGTGRGAARAFHRVGDAGPDRQSVDPWMAHGAADVDDDVGPPASDAEPRCGRGWPAARTGRQGRFADPLAPDRPRAQDQQDDGERPIDE